MHDLYKGFKKVADDEKSAVLEHEQGHRITLAKSGLGKKQKKALKGLPLHQAQGTPVSVEEIAEEEKKDAGNVLKQIGAQITDAVAKKVVEGAEESVLSPQQIEQMPEPTATDVQTGEPVYKAPGAISITPEERYLEALGPQQTVVGPLDVIKAGLKPGGGSQTYSQLQQGLEQKQQTQEEVKRLNEAEKQRLLQVSEQTPTEPELTPTLAPEKKPLVQQPAQQPLEPTIDLTRPIQPPAIVRPPEEVMLDPNASEADRAQAFFNAAVNTQRKIEQANEAFRMEMQKPENQLNPNRYWQDMSAPRRIMTVIGMLLSGYAEGLTGRESPLFKILDKEVERDIQSQMQSREDKLNLFKQNLAVLKDSQAAYNQTANQLRTLVDMRMQEALRKLDPTNKAGALALQAGMAENKAKISKANEELTKNQLIKQYEQGIAQGKYVEIPDQLDQRADKIVRVPGPKGESIKLYARTPGMVKELQDKSNSILRARQVLQEINMFNKQYGRQLDLGIVDTSMADAAETLNRAANFAVQGLLATGTLTPRSEKLIQDIFPKAGALKQKDAQRKLTQANRLLNDELKVLIQNNLTK